MAISLLLGGSPLWAQHFVSTGFGFSLAFFDSNDLERFEDSYNNTNIPRGLVQTLEGVQQPVGLYASIGYHHFGRVVLSAKVGYQRFISKNSATFDNAESRLIELKMRHFMVEAGAGPNYEKFFLKGILTAHIARQIRLVSSYAGPPDGPRPLDGHYRADTGISLDFGLAIGFFKDPVVLETQVTYPLLRSGDSEVLIDNNPRKQEEGSAIFPDDYERAVNGEGYKGIAANIDGIKIQLTLTILFKI